MARRSEPQRLLGDLVAIPSVNPHVTPGGGEQAVAAHLAEYLRLSGLAPEVVECAPGRPSVRVTVRADEPRGHLLLCSHLDTVGVESMTIPPFEPRVEGGRLFGRGACDAKGPLAAMTVGLLRGRERGLVWDVTLWAVAGEEVGGEGVLRLLEDDDRFDGAIVGEPTEGHLVVAHKGAVRGEILLSGDSAHSSRPLPDVGALAAACRITLALHGRAPGAQVHPLCGASTLAITAIHAGEAANVIPGAARVRFDYRTVPPQGPSAVWEAVNAEVARLLSGTGIRSESVTLRENDWLDTEPDAPVARALEERGEDPTPGGAVYGSDAERIAGRGIPAVLLGPGSIDDAHTAAESIDLDELERITEVFAWLLTDGKTVARSP